MIILLCILPALFAQKVRYIPMTGLQPEIDGVSGPEWDSVSYQAIDQVYAGAISDSSDFSARWKALWDDANLYLLIQVTDDTLRNLGSGAAKFWIHDCAEVFFDLLNEKDQKDTDESSDDDNYQYRFIWDLDDEPFFEAPPSEGLINRSNTLVNGSSNTGYQIELLIPWSTLIQNHNFGEVIPGKQIGIELKIADLDRSIVPSGQWAPDAELLWNNPTGDNLKQTDMFGTIQLVKSLQDDHNPPGPITDLAATPTGSTSVSLSWSAPADDNTGRSKTYELGFATDSAVLAGWTNADHMVLTLDPGMPGSPEVFNLNTLDPATHYFFDLRSYDCFNHISGSSNLTAAVTFEPDLVSPGPVTDLSLDSSGSFMAQLSWTTTGDDGLTGTPAGFEIKYAHEMLTPENWVSATDIEGVPEPLEAGSRQSVRINGLVPVQSYYFGLRVFDEVYNLSEISNVVELTTPPFHYQVKHPVDQMVGTNSFIDVPMDKMEAVGFIREYHPWSFTEIRDDVYEFNRWNGFWDFDSYYAELEALGITTCPVLWESPGWLESNPANKPCAIDEDPTDPGSYSEMAQLMYQYAARYGSSSVPDGKLLVNEGQLKKSGLGLLTYFEDWNEQDRDWDGRDARFYPEEYAAMASANADGHAGSLGDGYGLKTADPEAKFVMGGLCILGTEYISEMYRWFQENRPDHQWPIDVINMHHYAYSLQANGISPEEDGFKARILEVINWRNEYAPENEVWITEFGYDTNNESPNRINPFGGFTPEEIQAQWITRSFLILSSAGVDRAAQFMLRDVGPNPEPRWRNSGLTLSSSENYVPKTSWYYVFSLKNILKGMYFDKVVSEDNAAYVYRFVDQAGERYVYALWVPSSNGTRSTYRLRIPEGEASLSGIRLADGSTEGYPYPVEAVNGMISLEISETPQFITVNYGEHVGVSELRRPATQEILVSPNPFSEQAVLKLPDTTGASAFHIRIFTPDGREVWSQFSGQDLIQGIPMDLSVLEKGIYMLVVQGKNARYVKKIVKN